MKCVCLSDTHNNFPNMEAYFGDIIIHCGDVSIWGNYKEVEFFIEEYNKVNFKYKILVPGNHDKLFEKDWKYSQTLCEKNNIICLNDSGIKINNINIWGSPITPRFFDWAFNRNRGSEIKYHWDMIPNNTDILVTHGPPSGVGLSFVEKILRVDDKKRKIKEDVGCVDLKLKVDEIKPKYHLFGHIHQGYGIYKGENTTFINCSIMNENYEDRNIPIEFLYL